MLPPSVLDVVDDQLTFSLDTRMEKGLCVRENLYSLFISTCIVFSSETIAVSRSSSQRSGNLVKLLMFCFTHRPLLRPPNRPRVTFKRLPELL